MTNSQTGLNSAQVTHLLETVGKNSIQGKKHTPLLIQFLLQFKDTMVLILIAASIIAYVAGETVDSIIILGIVFINAGIGLFQEFKAERAIEALKKLLSPKARVVRDGEEQMVDVENLVPGDLLILQEGDKVGADAEIFEENEMYADESILTGESVPVKKDIEKNKLVYMGTQIARGNAKAIVSATGMNTQFGRIAHLTTQTKKDKSPLQKELAHIGGFVGKITLVISGLLFIIGLTIQGRSFIDTLLFAVSVAVAAVPEGLPTTITVALAMGVQRLAKKNAIVKQLSSVETLGSTTVICSDKTGTLTKNEMTVQELVLGDHSIGVGGVGYEPKGQFVFRDEFVYERKNIGDFAFKHPEVYESFELACRISLICNNAKLTQIDDQWKVLGDPTEGAMITLAEKAGFQHNEVISKYKKLHEFPFDSTRKRMTVLAQDTSTNECLAYMKGAPESILPQCSSILLDGKVVALDEKTRKKIMARSELMANRALRIIALAYKPCTPEDRNIKQDEMEQGLIFVGAVGMIDPPREDVKEAVALTHKAGIRVFVITGDHGLTAHAITKELGIVKSDRSNIVTGEMLNKMDDVALKKLLIPGQETIFARVSPEHKLRIVEMLKQQGEVVAVTGDGVNDAPALKRADIGVAMGITGTDVSKEAANMVLADDSFGTIVTAIIEGRTIYENMKKFIYFIFSANIGEVLAVFGGIIIGLPAPLTAVFMLIINTLTDVFPSLALGIEPVERDILERPPRKPDAKIMDRSFVMKYAFSGLVIGLMTTGVFVGNLLMNGWEFGNKLEMNSALYIQSSTMAFVLLTFIQMVHAINSRSATQSVFRMKFFENPYLIAAIIFSTISTVAVVQTTSIAKYIKAMPLTGMQWGVLVGVSFIILITEEVRKVFTRRSMRT